MSVVFLHGFTDTEFCSRKNIKTKHPDIGTLYSKIFTKWAPE